MLCDGPEGWDGGGGLLCGYHSITAHWPDPPSLPSSSWDKGSGIRDSNTWDTNKYSRSLKNSKHVRCSHNNRTAKKTQRRGPQTEEGQRDQPTTLLRTFVSTPRSNSHSSLHCQRPFSLPFCPWGNWGSHKSRTCNPRSPGQWVWRRDSSLGHLVWEAFPPSGCSTPSARDQNPRGLSLSFPVCKMGLIPTPSGDCDYADKFAHVPHQADSLLPCSPFPAHRPALTPSAWFQACWCCPSWLLAAITSFCKNHTGFHRSLREGNRLMHCFPVRVSSPGSL